MNRKRVDTVLKYDPDGLRGNIKTIDQSIARLQEEAEKAKRYIEAARQAIAKNEKDIEIFHTEIGKLEQQKAELQRLIAQLEK